MIEGIRAALDFPHDPERLRFVCFLTDGFIGNEQQILAAVHDKLGDSRIFSVGIGSSTNRFLLERLAKLGRGAVAYIGLNDSSADINLLDNNRHTLAAGMELTWHKTRWFAHPVTFSGAIQYHYLEAREFDLTRSPPSDPNNDEGPLNYETVEAKGDVLALSFGITTRF